MSDADYADALRDLKEAQAAIVTERKRAARVIHENNALRRNNERLARRVAALEDSLRTSSESDGRANAADRTAQTMATHWRLKAEPQSANHDATKEDMCGGCAQVHLPGEDCPR